MYKKYDILPFFVPVNSSTTLTKMHLDMLHASVLLKQYVNVLILIDSIQTSASGLSSLI